MRRSLLVLLLISVAVAGCSSLGWGQREIRQLIPTDIPPGTVFKDLREVGDWEVEATLRLVRNWESRADGIAAVKILLTSKSTERRENVQVAIWLPEGGILGSNLEESRTVLTPEQPSSGYLTRFDFPDFERRDRIVEAFSGSTRIKIIWEGGGERYLQFPGSYWKIEVVDELPPWVRE